MARNTNGKGFSLKDHLFNKEKVQLLAKRFAAVDAHFDPKAFVKSVMADLLELGLKERVVRITEGLEEQLPKNFNKACKTIVAALPEPLDPNKTDDDFGDFIFAPLGEYVVRNGLQEKDVVVALRTLQEITQRFSMEDSIRYFINAFEVQTMKELKAWVTHPNYHVRRLVSEGTRPLLPWSGRLSLAVTAPLPLLDALHADNTRYITRSVANHMNDIAKIEPDLVVKTLLKWRKQGKQDSTELDWMTRHSLRTLLKQGHAGALELLGYHTKPKIIVDRFRIFPESQQVVPGDTLSFSFAVTAIQDEKLMIDYVIDFVKANGQTKPKVFKLKKIDAVKGEMVIIEKHHKLLANATTFKLYPGKHSVTLQINGVQHETLDFEIK
ncbi:MAG: 3-methyladenine DNA glycosylase AlkC [Patiriisocius sp.]|jgi:3-methyladenine DNA glycosylase AlkC